MVVDTSALGSILFQEPDEPVFLRALAAADAALISAATLVEATSMCARDATSVKEGELNRMLERSGIQVVAFDAAQAEIARAAYRRYGKGRHPARLNLGDTFSYALAIHLGEPLLFKGNDFAQTDVTPAV